MFILYALLVGFNTHKRLTSVLKSDRPRKVKKPTTTTQGSMA